MRDGDGAPLDAYDLLLDMQGGSGIGEDRQGRSEVLCFDFSAKRCVILSVSIPEEGGRCEERWEWLREALLKIGGGMSAIGWKE